VIYHDVRVEQHCHHKTTLFALLISTFGGLSLSHDAAGRAQKQQGSADASP